MDLYNFKLNAPDPTVAGVFDIQNVIENFESLIWTERYYGDSEAQIVFPIDGDIVQKLPMDSFIGIDDSDELLILETVNIEDNRLKFQAVSVLTWLNNRFVRTTNKHKTKFWKSDLMPPGQILWQMLFNAVSPDSDFITTDTTGIPIAYLGKLPIPEIGLDVYDSSDDPKKIKVAFGPLYDQMRAIAVTYQLGIKIVYAPKLDPEWDEPLVFRSYKGLNKTHTQDPTDPQNPIVRFSAELNSLNNLREIKSRSTYKTIAFTYAPSLDIELSDEPNTSAGVAFVEGSAGPTAFAGFKCRALQVLADDLTGFSSPTTDDVDDIMNMLNNHAKRALEHNILIQAVDGDIVDTDLFQYGRDYSLGDIVELEGSDGMFTAIRVTEHIISEEATGEHGYVTTGSAATDIAN